MDTDTVSGEAVHDSICMPCNAGNPDIGTNTPGSSDAGLENVIQNGSGTTPGVRLNETDLRDLIAFYTRGVGQLNDLAPRSR